MKLACDLRGHILDFRLLTSDFKVEATGEGFAVSKSEVRCPKSFPRFAGTGPS